MARLLCGDIDGKILSELAGYGDDGGRKDCFGGPTAPAVRYRKKFAGAP